MLHLIPEKLHGLFNRRSRAETEHEMSVPLPCCIVTRLTLVEKDLAIDGVVLEICPERALFREASSFILDRAGEQVKLTIDGAEYNGTISSTSPRGYRIGFDEPIREDHVQDFTLKHGVDAVVVV
jgi:hypothetical protein